jgi:gamma-glutamyltranspeptidase
MAARIAKFYQDNGGVLSTEDLSSYEPKWVTPISTTYRATPFTRNHPAAAPLLFSNN